MHLQALNWQVWRSKLRRLGVVVDHGFSSLSNMLVTVILAATTSPRDVGAFAVAFSVYFLGLATFRALVQEPLLLEYRIKAEGDRRAYIASAIGAILTISIVGGLVVVVVGILFPVLRPAFLPLAACFPLLMLQDLLRYVDFAEGRVLRALAADFVWVLGLVVLGPMQTSLSNGVLVWAAAGSVGALLFGPRMLLEGVRRTGRVAWFKEHRSSGGFFLLESLIDQMTLQVSLWSVAVIAGLDEAGILRVSQVMLAPVRVVMLAVTVSTLPDISHSSFKKIRRAARQYVGVSVVLAVTWLGLLFVIPAPLLRRVFGPTWEDARLAALALGVGMAIGGVAQSRMLILKALSMFKNSLATRTILAPLSVVCSLAGASLGGAPGAAWGSVVAVSIGAVVWSRAVRIATRNL
jgi:O-antigen/teichoic acid export membrane protein